MTPALEALLLYQRGACGQYGGRIVLRHGGSHPAKVRDLGEMRKARAGRHSVRRASNGDCDRKGAARQRSRRAMRLGDRWF